MTTTANKAGLRAAATARTAKAAQRTPLPPKSKADIELAREAVEESKARKPAKATAAGARAVRVADAKAELAAKVPAKPVSEVTTGKAATRPPDDKLDKAGHYAAEFINLGWKPEVTRTDGLHELVATRGTEAIYLAWLREAHVSGTSTYTIADRTVKVRNPAEAMRVAARKPEEAKEAQAKVASNKQFRRRPTGPMIRNIPFDVETATEEEIVAALESRVITWHNQYRVESESATVGSARSIHVSRHAKGHRIFSFVDPTAGYRAFKLENLENVGRKVNLDRIKHDILLSLARAEKTSKSKAA